MAKNDFLARQAAREDAAFYCGLLCGRQQMIDMFAVTLADPDVMKKDTMGVDRQTRIIQNVQKLMDEYDPAFQCTDETDYWQEHLDARLKNIFGDKFDNFANRYPFKRDYDYKKGRWKK